MKVYCRSIIQKKEKKKIKRFSLIAILYINLVPENNFLCRSFYAHNCIVFIFTLIYNSL